MKLSLVVTVKNEAHSAHQLIEDIQAQTRRPDEWFVVDAGSTDRTAELFEQVAECTVLLFPSNIAEGRNHGIRQATGDVIVMTDAGCRLEATWLEELEAAFQQTSPQKEAQENAQESAEREQNTEPPDDSIGYVGGPIRATLERPFDIVQWSLLDQLNFSAVRQRQPLFSCRNIAFRRQLWQRCPFPEWLQHGEDAWVFDRWRRLGFRASTSVVPVEWHMRRDLRSFALQHFRYMKGDGFAKMRLVNHCLRLAYYGVLLALLVAGVFLQRKELLFLLTGAWLPYLLANGVRLLQLLSRYRKWHWIVPSFALLPAMLVCMDGAKIAGVLAGLGTSPAKKPTNALSTKFDGSSR